MKEKTGVTLIALIITIIVMLILAGVSISVGTESIRNAQRTKFDSELRVIHIRVNEILEEMSVTEVGQMLTLNEYDYNIPSDKNSKAITALGSSNLEGYWYFNKAGLEKLGVSSIDREVLINFTTKDIVDLEGIDSNGEKIYRLLSWRNEEYIDKTANAIPSFTLSKKIYGLNATIIVNSLNYGENVSKGSISYCLLNQDGTDGELRHISGTEIPVSVSGTYKVIATNSAGKSSSNQVNIALTNQPKLDSGMVPVVYVEAEPQGYWEIADENGGLWYDYAEDKAMWANVMLLDDLTVEGGTTVTAANKGDLVGKKVLTSGSIFVWIPRYMYKEQENIIQIKFLKGTTNLTTDNTNEVPVNSGEDNTWNVHQAFNNDEQLLTGVWVQEDNEENETKQDAMVKLIPSDN